MSKLLRRARARLDTAKRNLQFIEDDDIYIDTICYDVQ